MYVRDLSGNEYAAQLTYTWEGELNSNQQFSATILPSKVNRQFIHDIAEMWVIADHDGTEYKIIYSKRQGTGDLLKVDIKAIPLFFDDFDTQRIYERYDTHMTDVEYFSLVFNGSGYNYILNGTFYAQDFEGLGDGVTRLSMFQKGLERYKAEFRISGNTIYLENQIGRDTQFQYRYKLNASNIVQEIDAAEMYTYAKGYGDYEEGGNEDAENNAGLIREYTSPLADIIGIREAPPIKNGSITTVETMDEQLQILVDESLKISVSADIHDLRKQGYALAQPQLGDRTFLIDERIGLDEEVRVVNMSVTKNWEGEVTALNLTFGSQGLAKRYQSNLQAATDSINQLLEGKIKLPYSVLDNAVAEATEALQSAQTELKFSDNGILAVDKNDPNLVTLFNSAGLGVSDDGGATFKNAITGMGINASVVTTGSLDANRVRISAYNGIQTIGINDSGFQSLDSNGNTRIHLGIRDLAGKGQSDPATIRFFSGNGDISAGVGMNVNDHFIIGSDSNAVSMELHSGQNTLYYAQQHRFVMDDGSRYWKLTSRYDSDGSQHPIIEPDTSGKGYVGVSSARLWRVHTNHIHYVYKHEESTRSRKTNITDMNPSDFQAIFDEINLKSFNRIINSGDGSYVDNVLSYGQIAEDSPDEITDSDKKSINEGNYIAVIAGALKYQQQRIDNLENKLEVS
ncbi:hypothetical protein GCM10007063_05470 [Lentibacillus kapialis]|uniref:Peptidase S74 domain-containing protein n=1 Tax=Lentibacillus kapialis TaxID=340214 RepID=A0A917PP01_9BACI|nr:phage tail protein [Lentibacillus kapialis]GGJ85917.1 hypothetical protein GCM10007063_05470 [Lentibacillus kapialis]